MTFEQDYIKLIVFAKMKLNAMRVYANHEEIVNESYVRYIDSGEGYNLDAVRKIIVGVIWGEYEHSVSLKSLENIGTVGVREERKFCKKCSTDKPIAEFYYYINSHKRMHVSDAYCMGCRRAATDNRYKKWRILNPITRKYNTEEERIEYKLNYRKEWVIKNRGKWNQYMRTRREPLKKNKIARPIHELWREANRRYYAKKKMKNLTLLQND